MHLAILGAGPGGYTAAFEAQRLGHAVTLIDPNAPGGTCLHCGCIPTKTLRSTADALMSVDRFADMGISSCAPTLDLEALRKRKDAVIRTLEEGLIKTCAKQKIRVIQGRASFADAKTIVVNDERLAIDAAIIATGSRVLELPSLPLDHQYVCSSDDALRLTHIPKRLLIVGGGVIGCELACIYQAFGSEVTIVEGLDRLLPLPAIDHEVSTLLAREMRKKKIRMHLGSTLEDVRVVDGGVQATIAPSPFLPETSPKAAPQAVSADMILVTVGRAPNTDGLGLEALGVQLDKRGWIQVDANLRTSVPGIYAIGDVLGPSHIMLAHVASCEALCAVENLNGQDHAMAYTAVPSAIFTDPEIADVGLSEEGARKAGFSVCTATTLTRELGKAQAMGALPGFTKIVACAETKRILGVHIVGAHASDIIAEAGLAVTHEMTVQQLAQTIHAHPTLAEGLYETARKLLA
ncbi:MAG: dihydrolipoyl dehydrogenase [Desulfovibrio sp.]|nr:dihydrolipoyl dehydrogenase [Desulfovibrio sp.]